MAWVGQPLPVPPHQVSDKDWSPQPSLHRGFRRAAGQRQTQTLRGLQAANEGGKGRLLVQSQPDTSAARKGWQSRPIVLDSQACLTCACREWNCQFHQETLHSCPENIQLMHIVLEVGKILFSRTMGIKENVRSRDKYLGENNPLRNSRNPLGVLGCANDKIFHLFKSEPWPPKWVIDVSSVCQLILLLSTEPRPFRARELEVSRLALLAMKLCHLTFGQNSSFKFL